MTLINSAAIGGQCPICGEAPAACGGPSTIQPVDRLVEVPKMADLKRYQDKDGNLFSTTAERAAMFGYTLADSAAKPEAEAPAMPEPEPEPEAKAVKAAPEDKAMRAPQTKTSSGA